MMTINDFNNIPYGEIFDSGIIDASDAITLVGTPIILKWIAKKGGGNDWAIYTSSEEHSDDFIKQNGQKVRDKENILKLVPCDEEMYAKYRK